MKTEMLQLLVTAKSGAPPQTLDEATLARFDSVLVCSAVLGYLKSCVPTNDYFASGLRVLSLQSLERENLEHASPGQFIFPFGYLVVATSVGGNALCLDSVESRIVWAGHDSFFDELITFKTEDGEWVELQEYSRSNVSKAIRVVDQDIEQFLLRFLRDEEEQRLDALDMG